MCLISTKSLLGLCNLLNWEKGLDKTCKHKSVVQQNSTLNVISLCWGATLTQIPSLLHKYIRLYLTQSDLCSWLQGLPPLKQWPDHYHNQGTNRFRVIRWTFQKVWAAKYRKIFFFFFLISQVPGINRFWVVLDHICSDRHWITRISQGPLNSGLTGNACLELFREELHSFLFVKLDKIRTRSN